MRVQLLFFLSFLLLTFLATGCSKPGVAAKNLLEDCTDVARIDLTGSIKPSVAGGVKATEYVQVQGYHLPQTLGVRAGGRVLGEFEEEIIGWHIMPGPIARPGLYHAEIPEGMVVGAKSAFLRKGPKYVRGDAVDEFGLGLHLAFIGFRLGIRPVEFVDVFSNFFQADMLDDNSGRY